MKTNKEIVTNAQIELVKNGGLEEAAITTNGKVYVRDQKGVMTVIGINQFDPNKYVAVTNNELMNSRVYNTSLAFNNNVVSVLSNGVGVDEITKSFAQIVDRLKADKVKNDGFLPAEEDQILKTLEEAKKGILKITNESEGVNEKKIEHATAYILRMLPQNQRNLLNFKAKENNITVEELLINFIAPSMSSSASLSMDLMRAREKKKEKGESSGSSSGSLQRDVKFQESYVANMMMGKGLSYTEFRLGGMTTAFAPHFQFNSIKDSNQKDLAENATVTEVVNAMGNVADGGSVYFGDQYLSPVEASRAVTDGHGYAKVYLPYLRDEKTGKVHPNLAIIKKMDEVEKKIKDDKITDPEVKRKMYQDAGILEYLDMNIRRTDKIAPFLCFSAYMQTSESSIEPKDPNFYRKVDTTQRLEDWMLDAFNRDVDPEKKQKSLESTLWWTDKVYKGVVFIHTKDDTFAAASSSNPLTIDKAAGTVASVKEREKETESQQRAVNIKSGNASKLN